MSNEPDSVKAWRDTFKLNLNVGFKHDITVTITDLASWVALLNEWKEKKWNPLNVKGQLSEYERRATKQPQRSNASNGQPCERRSDAQTGEAGIPERSHFDLPSLPNTARSGFRRSSPTLEEVVAQAVRQMSETD